MAARYRERLKEAWKFQAWVMVMVTGRGNQDKTAGAGREELTPGARPGDCGPHEGLRGWKCVFLWNMSNEGQLELPYEETGNALGAFQGDLEVQGRNAAGPQ